MVELKRDGSVVAFMGRRGRDNSTAERVLGELKC